jgi:hypothetical protein
VSHITEISKPTQWKPGQSGNLNGRPVGTRQAFSAGFYRDLAEVFAKHGRAAMEKTAQDQPSVFFGICARLLPNDVRVTVEQSLPGNLSMNDWQTMKEVIEAVRPSRQLRGIFVAEDALIGKPDRFRRALRRNCFIFSGWRDPPQFAFIGRSSTRRLTQEVAGSGAKDKRVSP